MEERNKLLDEIIAWQQEQKTKPSALLGGLFIAFQKFFNFLLFNSDFRDASSWIICVRRILS